MTEGLLVGEGVTEGRRVGVAVAEGRVVGVGVAEGRPVGVGVAVTAGPLAITTEMGVMGLSTSSGGSELCRVTKQRVLSAPTAKVPA